MRSAPHVASLMRATAAAPIPFQYLRVPRRPRPKSRKTTSISLTLAFRVSLPVIRTSCPRAVRHSISRPIEKLPARLRISAEVALVGLKARSIERDALFVTKSPAAYEVISTKGHPGGKPFALRLAGSRDTVCRDIRDCEGIAAHPHFRR
jgi:hypothetical protein